MKVEVHNRVDQRQVTENTRFFHTATLVRKRRKRVEALMDDQGRWVLIKLSS